MSVRVMIPCSLRKVADGHEELNISCGNTTQLLLYLKENHGGLYKTIYLPSGAMQPFVKIFINQDDVMIGHDQNPELKPGDVVNIVTAIAGG